MTSRRKIILALGEASGLLAVAACWVRADNCGSFHDCYETVASAAAAIAALATGMGLLSAIGSLFGEGFSAPRDANLADALPGVAEGISATQDIIGSNFWTSGLFPVLAGAGISGLEALSAAHLGSLWQGISHIGALGGLALGGVSDALELANIYMDNQDSPTLGNKLAMAGGIDVLSAALGEVTIEGAIAAYPLVAPVLAVAATALLLPTWAPIAAVCVVAAGALVVEGIVVNAIKARSQVFIDAAAQ